MQRELDYFPARRSEADSVLVALSHLLRFMTFVALSAPNEDEGLCRERERERERAETPSAVES